MGTTSYHHLYLTYNLKVSLMASVVFSSGSDRTNLAQSLTRD